MAERGHKSEWQVSLRRGALWYLRWWLDRQIIIPSIRVSFPSWSLQHLMACSQRSLSGCPHSRHYPTRSPVVTNDKRLEYWFVNLQSGAIRCRLPNYEFNECKGSWMRTSPAEDCCEPGFFGSEFISLVRTGVQDRPVSVGRGVPDQERWPDAYRSRTLIQSVRILD